MNRRANSSALVLLRGQTLHPAVQDERPRDERAVPEAERAEGASGDFTGRDAGLSPKYRALKQYFGYDSFREGQEPVVDAILSGRDVLAVMPTGAGKSTCYQVPALVLDGVALVISPLISLMKDQVQSLIQSGIPAAYLNSSLSERQFDLALSNAARGKYRIIYVAPERLQTPRFLAAARAMRISLVAVDRGALHLPVGAGLPAELSRNSGLSERTAQASRRLGVHRDGADRARSRGHPVAAAAGRPGRSDHGL